MARRRWRELDPRVQRAVVIAAGVEGGLRLAALLDLALRDGSQVRGRRGWWAAALLVLGTGGVLPVVYFLRGARRPER